MVDKVECRLLIALNLERKDASCTIGEVALVEIMIGMIGQSRVINLLHQRLLLQIIKHFERIIDMTFNTKTKRFKPL